MNAIHFFCCFLNQLCFGFFLHPASEDIMQPITVSEETAASCTFAHASSEQFSAHPQLRRTDVKSQEEKKTSLSVRFWSMYEK